MTPAAPGKRALGVALAALAGLAVAVQSRLNGQLAADLRDGIAASLISFGSGLLLLLALLALQPALRRGLAAVRAALRSGRLRGWHCAGGLAGALFVAAQGITVPSLGVAVFIVAVVAGQSASSLVVDRSGVGPGQAQPITARRVTGAVLTLVAVVLTVADQLADPRTLGLAALPVLAGVAVAWQQAANGRIREAAASAPPASFVNFLVGTAALATAFAIDVALRGWPAGSLPSNPLLYLGGTLGVVFIGVAAAVVRFTGVLLLGLAMIAGQVIGAVLIDLLAPAAAAPAWHTLAGAALALVAVGVAAAHPPAPAAAGLSRRPRSDRGTGAPTG